MDKRDHHRVYKKEKTLRINSHNHKIKSITHKMAPNENYEVAERIESLVTQSMVFEDNEDFDQAFNNMVTAIEMIDSIIISAEKNNIYPESELNKFKNRKREYMDYARTLKRKQDERSRQSQTIRTGGDKGGKSNKFKSKAEQLLVSKESLESPYTLSLDEIVGHNQAKRDVKLAFEGPIKRPDLYGPKSTTPPNSILLYGPPGNGKTVLAKALSKDLDVNFMHVRISDIHGSLLGDSEKQLAAIFEVARENYPTIMFIDEIDGIMSARSDHTSEVERRTKNVFLSEMEGFNKDPSKQVYFIFATNNQKSLDIAFMSRIKKKIEVGDPSDKDREDLFKLEFNRRSEVKFDKKVSPETLGKLTTGMSGRDINTITENTVNEVYNDFMDSKDAENLNKQPRKIVLKDFEKQIRKVQIANEINNSSNEVI